MKRIGLTAGFISILLLGGCLPSIGPEQEEVKQENEEEQVKETVSIPEVQIKEEFYRILMPFKPSASRGLIVSNLATKYDMKEVEEGLMRLSTQYFDPKNYFFQEGQYIDRETARKWLARSSENEEGLNPKGAKEGASKEEIENQAPIYLAHIVEQNYLTMTDKKEVRLSGISIGLALNSIHYTKDGKEIEIPQAKLVENGKKIAEQIASRLRAREGLENIPIVIGLFKQESRNSIVPGTYFAKTIVEKGKKAPADWEQVNEQYVLLPASEETANYREINTTFSQFKQNIDTFFPNFVNVIGTAYFRDQRYESLQIELPVQFYGNSEIIGFTQYVASLLSSYYQDIKVEISITSVNGPEALIVKEKNDENPYIHIYGY